MVGSFAVGKTSLVRRFVESIYSDTYHTTVGVKVDKKTVRVNGQDLALILWDIYGWDEFQSLKMTYLRGMPGYLLVVDGTRKVTFDTALSIQQSIENQYGKLPFVLLLNKNDLTDEWEIEPGLEQGLLQRDWKVLRSSAKTGENVEAAFLQLAQDLLAGREKP